MRSRSALALRLPARSASKDPCWRCGLVCAGLTLVLLFFSSDREARAQEAKPAAKATAAPLTEIKVVERVTAATDRALVYLASKQRPDGGWHNNHAVNAVALLAFLGRGHVPGRGPYRDVLEKGKKFLLA